jgi:ribulose-5-phosphate 4-epimerase/fuculose-1-phosphate aldolase
MEDLIASGVKRLVDAGLAAPDAPLFGGIDDVLVWNRSGEEIALLAPVFDRLQINSLLYCRPAEPYGKVIDFLSATAEGPIRPDDTESRTFLHEIEVSTSLSTDAVAQALGRRKGVILPGGHVATAGTVSPEQAYLYFSSVCFASLVKFLSLVLTSTRTGGPSKAAGALLEAVLPAIFHLPAPPYCLSIGPFDDEGFAQAAMAEAGREVVRHRLVDSFFGNISYRVGDTLHISQTSSALDRLEGEIDPVAMDGHSSHAITASSELSAHLEIVRNEPVRAILHGHPRFSVVLSLDCERTLCEQRGECHIRCEADRRVGDVPIIPGEVGTGPFGIATTLPPAIHDRTGVIVYGHGVFTVGRIDFNDAFARLVDIERMCRDAFLAKMGMGG